MGARTKMVALVIGLILSATSLVVYVTLSGGSPFSQRETAAWTVILWAFQVAVGYLLGELVTGKRARAEFQPFLKSAIRRTYGLKKGLERAYRNLENAQEASSSPATSDAALALLDERVHGARQQIVELISQADSSIDDWREAGVAEEEFRKLAERENTRQAEVDSLVAKALEIRVLSQGFESSDSPSDRAQLQVRLAELSSELQLKAEELQNTRRSQSVFPKHGVRRLLASGSLSDAINRYSTLIDGAPTSYGNYVGRAQARYLNGEVELALNDMDRALALQMDEYSRSQTEKARTEMETGVWSETLSTRRKKTGKTLTLPVLNKIREGNSEAAKRSLREAEELGLRSSVLRGLLTSMICFLSSSFNEAEAAIDALSKKKMDSFMEIHVACLEVLLDSQQERSIGLTSIRAMLRDTPAYDYSESPVRRLEAGLAAQGRITDQSETLFTLLRSHSKNKRDMALSKLSEAGLVINP